MGLQGDTTRVSWQSQISAKEAEGATGRLRVGKSLGVDGITSGNYR